MVRLNITLIVQRIDDPNLTFATIVVVAVRILDHCINNIEN